MSGEKFNNRLNRRKFIKIGGVLLTAPLFYHCESNSKKYISFKISGANHQVGHLLRTNKFPNPSETYKIKTLIVGGGVSGLSAARWLKNHNEKDFMLIEMDEEVGGNSKGGHNEISAYPYGAHYLPLPNNDNHELMNFLEESKIIVGYNEKRLPIYNEYFLCASPHERLFYKGIWNDELVPKSALNEIEKNEWEKFNHIIQSYKYKVGHDSKPIFTIPLENSSQDPEYIKLDMLSMYEYMKAESFTSEFIYWYVNYCCKDDFGSNIKKTSAWAGLHYFCSRTGIADNASHNELLTWPEGNQFLITQFKKYLLDYIKPDTLIYKIEKLGDRNLAYIYNSKTNKSYIYECQNIILATPQYVNKKILPNIPDIDWDEFQYYPWIVANITITRKQFLSGEKELPWDNIIYDSESLGYVDARHQTIDRSQVKTVITFYYNFSDTTPSEARKLLRDNDEATWKKIIITELKKAHTNIEDIIENIDLHIWGHGMIHPNIGFKQSKSRQILRAGLNHIYFAHSDISGISIFEQAFYRGITAAKQTLGHE